MIYQREVVEQPKMWLIFFVLSYTLQEISSHGMMLDPPNRSSLWRFMKGVRHNYDDCQNFCGGSYTQWQIYGGKCGVCGDSYGASHPQPNENTGFYGRGIVPVKYKPGSVINVHIRLTANHMGSFEYSLCVLEDPTTYEPGESCFKTLYLADGSAIYNVSRTDYDVYNQIKLPEGLTCERCVLRWHYRAGNNWAICPDGIGRLGCGPQETFRSCSDIAIV